ncbi:DUF1189 domain-containing protein [Sporolactobacillus sp. THM7-4]|nr:DUF1189 domain-containing protein [Sporolactobacillus sp. THM7-4]
MFSPSRIFAGRNSLSWWKLSFLFIFINSCLMIPLTLQLSAVKTIPLSILMPTVSQTINRDFAMQMQRHLIINGELYASPYQQINGNNLIAIDPENKWKIVGSKYHQKIRKFGNALVFQRNRMVISDRNGFGFVVDYPKNRTLTFSGDKKNLENVISQLWVSRYRLDFLITISLLCFAALSLSNLFFTGMITGLLWLTKRSRISDIHSFREAAAIVMMSAGLPSIAASIVALISFNFGTLMMIESFGLVLMITLIFWRTHFQDEHKENKNKLALAGSRR